METLLPSEVARLVLGYLEEEKCGTAAKCFLDLSPHLSEYRSLALKGRRYPTKVNGYSLREVLDEYCLVHSIVQESLSSMSEQPSVGGSMIDSLRFLVRACQPVQVHINLHPQQGQNTSNKLECSDSTYSSIRPRSRKTTIEPSNENLELPSQFVNSSSPSNAFPPLLSEHPSTQRIVNVNKCWLPPGQNQLFQQPHSIVVAETQNSPSRPNVKESGLISSSESSRNQDVNPGPRQEQSGPDSQNVPHQEAFQDVHMEPYEEPPPVVSIPHLPEPSVNLKNPQHQLQMSGINTSGGVLQSAGSEFTVQPQEHCLSLPMDSGNGSAQLQENNESLSLDSGSKFRNLTNPEEPVRSYTVTKCYGSNIVILDTDNISQSSITTSGIIQSSNIQDNNDLTQSNLRSKITTPTAIEPAVVGQKLCSKILEEKILEDNVRHPLVTMVVEKINRNRTPSKRPGNDESQGLGEVHLGFDDATLHSIMKETEDDPYFEQFLREFLQFNGSDLQSSSDGSCDVSGGNTKEGKKKNRLAKKKSTPAVSKSMPGTSATAEGTVANCFGDTKSNGSVPIGSTPAKVNIEQDSMTPITKFLNSITSPLRLDSTPITGLMDLPESATKIITPDVCLQEATKQPQPVCADDGTHNKILQLSQPNGTTLNVPILLCNSNQQVAQYINEKGVNTIFAGEIQVMPQQGPYVPIVPKLHHGEPIPAALLGNNEFKSVKGKKRPAPKRCLTRGGRRSAGQVHQAASSENLSDMKNTVTMYAADSQEEVSSTITVGSSSDLPILMSDTPEQVVKSNSSESEKDFIKSDKSSEPKQSKELQAETECSKVISETKGENSANEEETNLPTVNTSAIRNTPGLSGLTRPHDKRLSFSTPRRRLSHIRALDFKTPPKEGDHSFRKANTSPKNASTNALSPHTTGKSNKSFSREGLFKFPVNGSRRTSKVKAHLFKSPDYPLGLSSGYKVPSAAVTSTPSEPNSTSVSSPLQRPSSAWDEVGGVSLILESDMSPVKHPEPTCKKEVFKSWDTDLRSAIGSAEEKSSAPDTSKRKRKMPPPAEKKVMKKIKKNQEKEEVVQSDLSKGEETLEKSQNASTESECEVAKMIEQNLLDVSCSAISSSVKESPSKMNSSHSSPKAENLDIEDNIKAYCIEKDPVGGKIEGNESISDESSISVATSKIGSDEKLSQDSSESGQLENSVTAMPPATNCLAVNTMQTKSCVSEKAEKKTENLIVTAIETKELTPLTDSTVSSAAENRLLSQVTWKESFLFNTPLKDGVNVIPQTPRFLSPNSVVTADTPHTKIIKSLPFPIVPSADVSIQSPTVPPTPTIRTTPSVSPNGPAYFQPIDSSPSQASSNWSKNSPNVKADNLESILIKECSRIEADKMRESVKMSVSKLQEKELMLAKSSDSYECTAVEHKKTEGVKTLANVSKSRIEDRDAKSGPTSADHELGSPSEPRSEEDGGNEIGCARLTCYQRKNKSQEELIRRVPVRDVREDPVESNTPRIFASSGDDSDDCVVLPPNRNSTEWARNSPGSVVKRHQTADVIEITEQRKKESENAVKTYQKAKQKEFTEQKKKGSEYVKTCQNADPKTCAEEVKKGQETGGRNCKTTDWNTSAKCGSIKSAINLTSSTSLLQFASIKGVKIEEALDRLHDEKNISKKSVESASKLSRSPMKMPLSPVILTTSEQTSAGKLDNLMKNGQSKGKLLSTPIKNKIPAEKKKASSSKKKPNCSKDMVKVVSEHESSESSSESSSSDSDSDTSSSSSSEEGTPVKENVSPLKLDSPVKTRSRKTPEKRQLKEAVASNTELSEKLEAINTDQSEFEYSDSTHNQNENVNARLSLLLPGKGVALPINLELNSQIETNKSNCEKSAKMRNAHNLGKPIIFTELELKRQRVVQTFKTTDPCGRNVRKIPVSVGNSIKPRSSVMKIVSEVKDSIEEFDKQGTKDAVRIIEIPKKRRSKSETVNVEPSSSPKDLNVKRRSASDSTSKLSDEDEEFKLHLSGDEKEESPSKSPAETCNSVELQIAALHADGDKSDELHSSTKESKLPEVNNVSDNCKSKADPSKTLNAIPLQSSKGPSKCSVSSKSADALVKNFVEQGLGRALQSLPTERIKKISRPTNKSKSPSKSENKPLSQVLHEFEDNSSSHVKTSSKSRENSLNGNSEDVCYNLDDEMPEEIVLNTSTSTNSLDLIIMHKGLGNVKPKKDPISIKDFKVMMGDHEDESVVFSPTSFFTLYESSTSRKQSEEVVCERKNQNSDKDRPKNNRFSKTDRKGLISNSSDRGDTRIHRSGDRSSDDRGRRYRNECRMRRNRSPSPKYRHSRDYSVDHDHRRDSHRSQDHGSRSRSNMHSSYHGRRCSDSESRSREPSNSKTKTSGKEEAEEGEILSSDTEKNHHYKSQRTSSTTKLRCIGGREGKSTAERGTQNSQRGKRTSSPPKERNSRRSSNLAPVRHHIYVKPSPDKKHEPSSRLPKEEGSLDVKEVNEPTPHLSNHVVDEDCDDVDLDDDMNFPVLGDDEKEENDLKDTEQITRHQDDHNSSITRRRAPPRSVNAHKAPPTELKTPIQKGKRKLSSSPDDVSEESCQSSLGSANTESKQVRVSQRKASSKCTTPAAKILKTNEGEHVADSTEIIKNLDVESFLSKIHG